MSLFLQELLEATANKTLIKVFLANGAVYTCFVKNLDEEYLKIAYLDIVVNSDIDGVDRAFGDFMSSDDEIIAKTYEDKIKDIDYIFCDSIIRFDMIEKIDFNVIHGLRPTTAQYVNFYQNNELIVGVKKPAEKKRGRKKKQEVEYEVDLTE